MGQQAVGFRHFLEEIGSFCEANAGNLQIAAFVGPLAKLANEWTLLTSEIGKRAAQNADEIGAAAVDYLFYSGYVCFAYFMARQAEAVTRANYSGTPEFREGKLATVRFYYDRLLSRTLTHADCVRAGAESLTTSVEAALI